MGVGAAQVLMKSGGDLPEGNIVIVGSGPLPLLLTEQHAKVGRPVRAVVEPVGCSRLLRAVPLIHCAAAAPRLALKGVRLLGKRLLRGTPVYRNARKIEIIGDEVATGLRFQTKECIAIEATTVLLHEGIIPNLNPIRAAELSIEHSEQQATWHAKPNDVIALAGDGAGILGVDAAISSGRLAARRSCGVPLSAQDERILKRQRAFRRFIDRAYPPVRTAISASPETVLCRCEMITAGSAERAIGTHGPDPDAIKRAVRLGMGPCQGRLCSHSLADFAGAATHIPAADVGLPRARNPIVPVSFKDLAQSGAITTDE